MRSLIELRVTDNRLSELPPSIARLSRLRELHVRNNRLTTVPEDAGSSTGDSGFDGVLTTGLYGRGGLLTLKNLTPGQEYELLLLADDERGGAIGNRDL